MESRTIILDAPVSQEASPTPPAIAPTQKVDLTEMMNHKVNAQKASTTPKAVQTQKPRKRITKKQQEELLTKCNVDSIDTALLFNLYNVQSVEEVTDVQLKNMYEHWDKIVYQCNSFF